MPVILPEAATSSRLRQSREAHSSAAVVEMLVGQSDSSGNVSGQNQGAGGMMMQAHTATAREPFSATGAVCMNPALYMQEAGSTQHVFQYIPYVSQVRSRADVTPVHFACFELVDRLIWNFLGLFPLCFRKYPNESARHGVSPLELL